MPVIQERPLDDGRSYRLTTPDGAQVVVVVRVDGTTELHLYDRGGHEPSASLRMTHDDARRLGAVLAGQRFRPVLPPDARGRLGDLALDWVRVGEASPLAGRTLADVDLHRRTGMTVVALVRGDATIYSPGADDPVRAGDLVVVLGQPRQLVLVQDLVAGGGG